MNNVEKNQVIPAVLELRDVVKNYQQGKHVLEVLKGVNLTIKTGELSALVGQSGAGKSTYLRSLNQLETITSGKIFIKGKPRMSDSRLMARIQIISLSI